MKIYYKCLDCKAENSFNAMTDSRFDLSKQKGEILNLICTQCKSKSDYHVNNLYAKKSKIITITAISIFVIGIIFIFSMLPYYGWRYLFLLMIPFGALIIPISTDEKNVSRFNSFTLRSGWKKKN